VGLVAVVAGVSGIGVSGSGIDSIHAFIVSGKKQLSYPGTNFV